jgi:hypothetical protein
MSATALSAHVYKRLRVIPLERCPLTPHTHSHTDPVGQHSPPPPGRDKLLHQEVAHQPRTKDIHEGPHHCSAARLEQGGEEEGKRDEAVDPQEVEHLQLGGGLKGAALPDNEWNWLINTVLSASHHQLQPQQHPTHELKRVGSLGEEGKPRE